MCASCKKWTHKRCSGIKGRLKVDLNYRCPICLQGGKDEKVEESVLFLGNDEKLECVDRFCYLSDMLASGGGADLYSRTRVWCAWNKCRELAPILTTRGASLKLKGKIYKACVRSVLIYGSETWAVKVEDMKRLHTY